MKEYFHQESDYIDKANYQAFNEMMVNYDFMPEDIQDEKEFNFDLLIPDLSPILANILLFK